MLGQDLHSVNCHATTETSDLLGGLRPVRGRDLIKREIVDRLKDLAENCPRNSMLEGLNLDTYISYSIPDGSMESAGTSSCGGLNLDVHDVDQMIALSRAIFSRVESHISNENQGSKRRKVSESCSPVHSDQEISPELLQSLATRVAEIEGLGRRYNSLFEWSDGPLVKAMKAGHMVLLDEMSLAEDAVLERLNSVLEPSRQLVLAEKGDDRAAGTEEDDRIITAHDDFRIFATMNPGGDFGKRELSPALRSRFTEIWVPSIRQRSDFEIVLGRTLNPHSGEEDSLQNSVLIGPILEYVEWFNSDVCGAVSSPLSGYALSLRDILSWAHFVVESRKANDARTIWDAFFHGACLMHLDGLGLGSGLAPEISITMKREAEEFLLGLVPDRDVSNLHGVDETFGVQDTFFGAFPYFIDVGTFDIPDSSKFNMTAPTTSVNTFRVLRAMQLKKPILLEGSPGVGKTSLINAIAEASGHKLVRINLSEQTDISDLMGCDLPVESAGKNEPVFEWRDGVLLTAIKEGSWVLLDELNLASQAVLEGLNSCLDHRSTVYIPELGRTFACPQTFRVFAAQNPLGQGGGRKGLPKSFLNRFTKVFVDALTDLDLRSIVASRFPSFSRDFVDQMIDFNNDIHGEVVELREFGSDGGPWEFNLRDVFRWSELLDSTGCSHAGCARDLYYQRFRSQGDRDRVDNIFQRHFGCSLKSKSPPSVYVSDGTVEIGETTLIRRSRDAEGGNESPPRAHNLLLSHLLPFEATARCINQRWPCLLVGVSGTGKTSIVSMLAELCNTTLVEQCLSPSSDVSELIGGFEQVERSSEETQLMTSVCLLADDVLMETTFKSPESRLGFDLFAHLRSYLEELAEPSSLFEKQYASPWHLTESLTEALVKIVQDEIPGTGLAARVQRMRDTVQSKVKSLKSTERSDGSSHFVWRDGILVEAMTKGYWLVLENVNLCPASVLDRLNSVTERDGFLLLSESGTQDGDCNDQSHRLIRPHENFRIFLTMDPSNGEISRAMRNRCVEISLLKSHVQSSLEEHGPVVPKTEYIDFLGILQGMGTRSYQLASAIIDNYADEHNESSSAFRESPCARRCFSSVKMMRCLLSRGLHARVVVNSYMQLSYETVEGGAIENSILDRVDPQMASPLPLNLSFESALTHKAPAIRASWKGRLLRVFSGLPSDATVIAYQRFLDIGDEDPVEYKVLDSIDGNPTFFDVQCILPQLYLSGKGSIDFEARVSALDGLQSPVAFAVRWMASTLRRSYAFPIVELGGQQQSTAMTPIPHEREASSTMALGRMKQGFIEHEWTRSLLQTKNVLDSSDGLTVLEASFFMHENLLGRSVVRCPITPLIFPFFLALDEWTKKILSIYATTSARGFDHLPKLFNERDRFWNVVRDLRLESKDDSFAAFDETEFIVQWNWMRKIMSTAEMDCVTPDFGNHEVEILSQAIDASIFGGTRPTWPSYSVRKNTIHPLVPRRAIQWEAMLGLKALDRACSLAPDHRFDPFERQSNPISLLELMNAGHAILYIPTEQKVQLLAAICTTQSTYFRNTDAFRVGGRDWIEEINFPKRVKESFEKLKVGYDLEIVSAKVDLEIETVDNQIGAEDLEELRGTSACAISKAHSYSRLKDRLLDQFSRVQLSAIAEFWCVQQEIALAGQICIILLDFEEEKSATRKLSNLMPQMKMLVDVAISRTIWEVGDMGPFQILIWAFEGKDAGDISLCSLLRSLVPTILATASRHSFTSSFVCIDALSKALEMPDMWNDDVPPTPTLIFRASTEETPIFGSARLRYPVCSELLLELNGTQLSFARDNYSGKLTTMENGVYRERQYREMLKTISALTFSPSKARLISYNFLLFDLLSAVRDAFRDCSMTTILDIVRDPKRMGTSSIDQIRCAGDGVKNEVFNLYWSKLLFPLMISLLRAWQKGIHTQEYAKQCALASVYLGLLRLNLLAPDTPLDPGKAPVGKVALITRRLTDIKSSVTAMLLNSGFVEGDFTPKSDHVMELLSDAELLAKNRISQRKKIIERVQFAPSYHELFMAIRDFLTFTCGISTVLELIDLISDNEISKGEPQVSRRRIHNWQRTAAAFCRRLSSDFEAYEDVTMGIVDSIRMIQDGLFDKMLSTHGSAHVSGDHSHVLWQLLRYPMREDSEAIKSLLEMTGRIIATTPDCGIEGRTVFSNTLSIALLARLLLKKMVVGLKDVEMMTCSLLLESLSSAYRRFPIGENEDKSLEEMYERNFKEQFPDHRKEFDGVLSDKTDEMDSAEEQPQEEIHERTHLDMSLSAEQIDLVYRLSRGIFSGTYLLQIDSVRKIAFHSAYAAAYELKRSTGEVCLNTAFSEPMGGHAFAMSLSSMPKNGMTKIHSYVHENGTVVDFQNEACPILALSAGAPLERLMARTTQLLTAFPGHSILIGLGRVCEKVNKLNLMTTPIGKVMTGCEVILRQAQDWEQHASDRVKLGSPLTEIGQLISEWRKLELESWGKLIEGRQNRHIQKARRHWLRLHGILAENTVETDEDTMQNKNSLARADFRHATPQWVWKGFGAIRSKVAALFNDTRPKELKDLVKALDTFILTSTLGEFEERLTILRTCSNEMLMSYKTSDMTSTWQLQQSRTLGSIWKYYCQYRPLLAKKLEEVRGPVETKLKNETKLAKWDNQSYYALAESTERNHRKLMKILSEYDESLTLNVGVLLHEESYSGLRANADAHDELCTTLPSTWSMFPIHASLNTVCLGETYAREILFAIPNIDIVPNKRLEDIPMDGHISKMPKYASKMKSLAVKREKIPIESTARIGGDKASHFCNAIFARIESLRTKSTRPMKERALVELFRELKENGFSTSKWSTPMEMKEIQQLFILPTPSFDVKGMLSVDASVLNKAEDYYVRCLAETNALRSEVVMLGSKHMTKREMELMVNLCDSGMLLLTQQRCLLSTLIVNNGDLEEHTSTMHLTNPSLPPCQSNLSARVEIFQSRLELAFESIRQLSLLIQSVKHLMDTDNATDWARDVVSKLESLSYEKSTDSHQATSFVTWKRLEEVDRNRMLLKKAELLLLESRGECDQHSYLPLDVFDTCLDDVRVAFGSASNCKEVLVETKENETRLPMSNYKVFSTKLTSAIEQVLLTYQNLNREIDSTDLTVESTSVKHGDSESYDLGVWDCHKQFVRSCGNIDLKALNETLAGVLSSLRDLHDDKSVTTEIRECCVGLVANTSVLLRYLQSLSRSHLNDCVWFYHSASKLQFVILRVFRVLVGKGYCSDESADGDLEGEGDINGMTFQDDNDGTGMGEGEGKHDVTDQIENEDQLAGLKSEKDKEEDKPPQESKQMNDEEADKGMEMEADFDGDMYDLPEKPDKETEAEEEEGEELDREMSEDASPDEQVVDEKMWNDSDDEEDVNKDEEKFEKDSGVEGESMEDAIRTKEDEDEKQPRQDEDLSRDNPQQDKMEEGDGDTDGQEDKEEINEDTDDRYEDQHGVDVRDNDESQENAASEDQMQLDDELHLDDDNQDDPGDEGLKEEEENLPAIEETGEEQNDESVSTPDDEESKDHDVDSAINNVDVGMDVEKDEGEKAESDDNDDDDADGANNIMKNDPSSEEAHGIRSTSGTDAIADEAQSDDHDEDKQETSDSVRTPIGGTQTGEHAETDGHDGTGYNNETNEPKSDSEAKQSSSEIPNPFKDPGDASKFWHRKLNIVDSTEHGDGESNTEENENNNREDGHEEQNGDFEYSLEPDHTTQVLGEADEDEAIELDPIHHDDTTDVAPDDKTAKDDDDKGLREERNTMKQQSRRENSKASSPLDQRDKDIVQDEEGSDMEDHEENRDEDSDGVSEVDAEDSDTVVTGTKIVSDMSKLGVEEDTRKPRNRLRIEQDELVTNISASEANEARAEWFNIQGETQSLSRRLCEKLRLVMEPLVASKLRGDYRTGKRINMKRVIGYIASGYRKDKIWLRRTKPSKRDYRVLLAVDDSESMRKSGAGEMALRAMATVAVGMNQLEIGELGVASFGDDMKLVHPFHQPFTSESGADVVGNFKFDQKRTRIAMCVESAMAALEESGDRSSMQLVFLISDGRIERDSRSVLKRLIREMVERNILLAMIIVEGSQKRKDSILNMKEVTFEKGKPVVKRFIEDYPFPYYIVLDDVISLPEVLGDALKQWFEMLSQLQNSVN